MFVSQRKRVYVDEKGIPEKVDILTSYRRPGALPSQIALEDEQSIFTNKLGCFLSLLFILLAVVLVYCLAFNSTETGEEKVFFERSILESYLQQLRGESKEMSLEEFSKELNQTEVQTLSREIIQKMRCVQQNQQVLCKITPN